MVTSAQVHRLQDEDIHRIFDLAVRIARRELDVGDNRIVRIGRINLTVRLATQLFVRADTAERPAFERR